MAEQLTEKEDRIIKKWAPVLQKCGNLSTNEEKVFLASTLEKLRNETAASGSYTLHQNETVNIVDPSETNRLVVTWDEKGGFNVVPQHKAWVNNIS